MLTTPNNIKTADGFYVSYNAIDEAIYGSDTTALVIGQMEKFYLLNGNHRTQYDALLPQGLDACMAYFQEHRDQINRYSDKLTEPKVEEAVA